MNFSASKDYQKDGRYFQHSVIARNIDKLTFRPDDVIVDVGCGTGEESKAIAKKVQRVIAIDSSEEMLVVARAQNPAANLSYVLEDAQTIGDNADYQGRFDKAVCFFVLHWCPDHARALRSILACLKPGGEALFITVNRTRFVHDANTFLKGHDRWGAYVKDFTSSYCLWNRSVEETQELFATCGWTETSSEIQHHLPETELRMKLVMNTVLGISKRIPESNREDYLDDLWRWTMSRYPDETQPGYVFLPIDLMVTHASRPHSSLQLATDTTK